MMPWVKQARLGALEAAEKAVLANGFVWNHHADGYHLDPFGPTPPGSRIEARDRVQKREGAKDVARQVIALFGMDYHGHEADEFLSDLHRVLTAKEASESYHEALDRLSSKAESEEEE